MIKKTNKFINLITFCSGFFYFAILIGGLFIIKAIYKKNIDIFLENCKPNLYGTFFTFTFFNLYSMASGMIHLIC